MKTRVGNEQTRCRVAGGAGIVCSLFFVSFVSRQKKNTQLLKHLICGSSFENFTYKIYCHFIIKITIDENTSFKF